MCTEFVQIVIRSGHGFAYLVMRLYY